MALNIDNIVIDHVCRVLGELTSGSKITNMFSILNFFDSDIVKCGRPVTTKWKRLSEAIIRECKKDKSAKPFFKTVEFIMKPINFVNSQESWNDNCKEINSKLIFYGYELTNRGKIIVTDSVETVAEAQVRLNSFQDKLRMYEIHPNIMLFCREEFFQNNYFHAILEASKSVLQRVRDLSELELDGTKLIHQSLSSKNPVILIKGNMLSNDTDRSLYNGLKNLLETIVSLYRNPNAHTPKLFDITLETDAITAFSMMSLAHRILDNCINVRYLDN
ncbi:TIGR02391 family protein [Carnobacterium sp. TMP28]|uniref:TIGR02391 family protein n=1 Tax=Carnobacterium sp. TMP28 TaxID=3397060 RepID=UPI0039E0DE8F